MVRKKLDVSDLLSIADKVIENAYSGRNHSNHMPALQIAYKNQFKNMAGSGLYSLVYEHPEKANRVIKVFKEKAHELSAYGRYLIKVLKNPEYKYKRCLPKIFSIVCVTFKEDLDYYFCVEMEKLIPVFTEKEWKEYLPKRYPIPRKMKHHPILKKLWDEQSSYLTWDLHSGNIMLRPSSKGRKRNQWVLTDPFCDA